MLRQKCSYEDGIETRKKPKSKCKVSYLLKMLIYDDFSKNVISHSKRFCCLFEYFKLPSLCAKF